MLDKFCFVQKKLPSALEDKIWSLEFKDFGVCDGELRYRIRDVEDSLRLELIDFFKTCTEDEYLIQTLNDFHFDINKMIQGEWIEMHNEVSQFCPFEVILWLSKSEDFVGRDFLIQRHLGRQKVRPTNGLVCFLDTTDPDVFHGVDKLISDHQIISITGGLGRKEDFRND
ncbi:hypothetical protein [Halobacteriovorax sp. HLS]|uniref:hypothetical protein n=1 Tax=Halobacteriovorax sp. HLS TaxID=2234000 RepID=UPI000FD9A2C8|nr:hypothetical protein [Halobacteriovorax sp. HLS]